MSAAASVDARLADIAESRESTTGGPRTFNDALRDTSWMHYPDAMALHEIASEAGLTVELPNDVIFGEYLAHGVQDTIDQARRSVSNEPDGAAPDYLSRVNDSLAASVADLEDSPQVKLLAAQIAARERIAGELEWPAEDSLSLEALSSFPTAHAIAVEAKVITQELSKVPNPSAEMELSRRYPHASAAVGILPSRVFITDPDTWMEHYGDEFTAAFAEPMSAERVEGLASLLRKVTTFPQDGGPRQRDRDMTGHFGRWPYDRNPGAAECGERIQGLR